MSFTLSLRIIVLGICVLSFFGCNPTVQLESQDLPQGSSTLQISQEPQVKEEAPLLLLEEGEEMEISSKYTGPVADNFACHVCHMNYGFEVFAVAHAENNIGCVRCHGESDAHKNDEDNITPVDILYPREKIFPLCFDCHAKEDMDSEEHEPFISKSPPADQECFDCHGEHRLGYRTRRWDKNTGELILDDGVRMMEEMKLDE